MILLLFSSTETLIVISTTLPPVGSMLVFDVPPMEWLVSAGGGWEVQDSGEWPGEATDVWVARSDSVWAVDGDIGWG